MIAPLWVQLRLGPLLRRDRDKRIYSNLFKPAPPGYVGGWRAIWLRLTTRRTMGEPEDLHAVWDDRDARRAVLFCGPRNHFQPLTGCHVALLHELRDMTRQRWLRRADAFGSAPIGIHVRRGDFAEASVAEDFVQRGAIRSPIDWFVESLRLVRRMRGSLVPAVVVSDAPDHVISPLLDEESVTRADTGSAIGDLLVLSQARFLIASGGSSFSAWAAFLGQMPAVAYPGQSLTWFKIAPFAGQFIGEWNHQLNAPPLLQQQIAALGITAGEPVLSTMELSR